MAKNNDKKITEATKENKSDVIVAPDKVVEANAAENKPEQSIELGTLKPKEEKPHKPHEEPKPHKPELPHKEQHNGHGFVVFIFLCLLGGMAFFALQFEQNKQQNAAVLKELQAAYDEKVEALNYKINMLDTEVTNLKNRPIVEHAAGISENQLNQKIAALRDEIAHRLEQIAVKSVESVDGESATKESITADKIDANAIAAIKSVAVEEKTVQEILLASGAIMVRDLAEQGMSFAYEAEVLQILAKGNDLASEYVRVVRHFADSGIKGKNQLIRNFNKIFAGLNQAQTKVETQDDGAEIEWYEAIWQWLKNTIAVKKGGEKPVFIPQDDEILELVRDGRLQDALNELKISEKYAKVDSKPLNEWRVQVLQYLDFNSAINGLIMNSLANIKLKEMEHAAQ